MKSRILNVVIADDHPIILQGIKILLEQCADFSIQGLANNPDELMLQMRMHNPDILITDLSMPDKDHGDGINMVDLILRNYSKAKVFILTMVDNPSILHKLISMDIGGVFLKTDDLRKLPNIIMKQCMSGQAKPCYVSPAVLAMLDQQAIGVNGLRGDKSTTITTKEAEVLRLLATGYNVTDVAKTLCRSIKTISTQKRNAMHKLGLRNDKELYQKLKDMGFNVS